MKAHWVKSTVQCGGTLEGLRLNVNPKKSKAIIIGYSRLVSKINTEDLNKINIEEIEVPFVDKVKGITINVSHGNLKWKRHVERSSEPSIK